MSTLLDTLSGDVRVRFGAPCSCSQNNPPAEPDLAGVMAVYDALGRAVAVGALADRLGIADGGRLVERVGRFVAASPTLARAEAETGGIASAVARGLSGAAKRAWIKVETRAASIWARAASSPGLIVSLAAVGSGALLGSQYLSAQERAELVEIDNESALVGETLSRMSPEEATAALKALGVLDRSGGGGGLSWLAWGAIGLGALVVLSVLRRVP